MYSLFQVWAKETVLLEKAQHGHEINKKNVYHHVLSLLFLICDLTDINLMLAWFKKRHKNNLKNSQYLSSQRVSIFLFIIFLYFYLYQLFNKNFYNKNLKFLYQQYKKSGSWWWVYSHSRRRIYQSIVYLLLLFLSVFGFLLSNMRVET